MNRSSTFRMFAFAFLLGAFLPTALFGQEEKELAPVSKTYAVTNATIIQSPGRKLEHGTVVIKNGMIINVSKDAAVPSDAIVIKGDSLFIYAGFIDGLSHVGVTKSKEEPSRDRPKDPGNPTPERAGITPQYDVQNSLSATEKSIEEFRALGFTAAQVVPYGVYLPGSAAVVLMGGNSASRMVLTPMSSFYAELNTAQGVFPATVIGAISKWHDLYKQATSAKEYEALYASNRAGLERPVTDKILQSFYPVIDHRMPVLFKAEKQLDVHRVLALQKDLGFMLVLANVKEGWSVADKVKASGAKVFLSLDLPEDKDDDKKGDKKSDDKKDKKEGDKKIEDAKTEEKKAEDKKADEKKTEPEKTEPVKEKTAAEKEKDALEKRKKEFIEKYSGVAAQYQKAGILFGFSTLNAKSKDINANLRKIIAAGLTEDQALAALTTTPAQFLGLSDRLGSIDNGKLASLVITDKPYFNEKAKVRYVFVEGELYKQEVKDAKKDDAKKDKDGKKDDAKTDASGTWTFSTQAPDGKHNVKVVLKKEGNTWSGTISGDRIEQATDLKSVEITAERIKFSYTISVEGSAVAVNVSGTYDGSEFKGTSDTTQYGSFVTSGLKDPNAKIN